MSFGIPTGIVYDEDSSDFSDEPEEVKFNTMLDSFARSDGLVKVWKFSKKFEDHLRKTLGEQKYQEVCQKFPTFSKATRARLIAMENNLPIPDPITDILNWLGNKSSDKVDF
jgi:hypothetical protein